MEEGQIPQTSLVSDGVEAEVTKPDRKFSNVDAIGQVKNLMPKYRGFNPLHLNNRLLKDESFLNGFVDDYFQIEEVRNMTTEERMGEDKRAFKLGLRDVLTQGAYSGIAPSESIIQRSADKTESIQDIPAKDYRALIEKNPDKYQPFDIVTEDGKLAYQNNQTFAQHILEDPNLKKSLAEDRFDEFSDELAKGHNPTALVADNPNKLAKAYAVYDKFGSEGLTQYTNYLQFKEQGVPEGVPSNQFIQASKFVENATYNGKSLDDVVLDFIGRDEEDKIKFEEIQPNLDLENTIPKDLNWFTQPFYSFDESKGSFSEKPEADLAVSMANEFFSDLLKDESDLEEFHNNGDRSEEYGKLSWAIFSALENEETDFSYEDLFDTVMANHHEIEERGGNAVYKLDYDNSPFHAKLALDVLKHHPQYSFMVRSEPDGIMSFEPERSERGSWLGDKMKTQKVLSTDENGQAQMVEEIDKSVWGQVVNTTKTLGWGVTQDLGRIIAEPIARGLKNLVESETTDSIHEWVETKTGMTAPEVINFEEYGNAVGTAGMITPFISYLGGMYGIGRMGIKAGSIALSRITQAKTAHDVAKYGSLMQGTRTWKRRSDKLNHAIKNKADWVAGFGIYESGAAVIEATQPSRHSFFNTLPAMVTGDNANVVSEFYQKASGGQRVAMDVAGSVMFGTLADTMIKGLSFGAANAARMAGKKDSFKSIIFDPKQGEYVISNKPQFRSDYRKFWHNFRNELNRVPDGTATDSAVNAYAGRGFMKNPNNVETFHDFTKSFVDNADEFAGGIRKDIEDQIRFYENNYASRHADDFRLSDSEISQMVDEQYSEFISNTASKVRTIMKNAGAVDPDQLTRRFADSLGEVAPTTRQITEVDGRPAHITDAPMLRERGKSIIEKGDEIYEVDGHYWASDLANELRHIANKKDKPSHLDSKINTRLQSEEITRNSERGKEIVDEVTNQVNAYFGVPVRDGNGNLGYIIDKTDKGYTIRTDLGFETKGSIVEVTDDRLDSIVDSFEKTQITREQGEIIREGNPVQGELFELIDPEQITITRLGGQTDRFERAHRKLDGAKKHSERVQKQLKQNEEVLRRAGDDADRAKIQEQNNALMKQLRQTRESIREFEKEISESRMPFGDPLRRTADGEPVQYNVRNKRGEVINLDETIESERRNIDQPRQTRLFAEKFNKQSEEYRRIAEEGTSEQRFINVDDVGGTPLFSRGNWERFSRFAGRTISKTRTNARNILRNVGLFDNRWRHSVYTTKAGNKKRLIGKNRIEVPIKEYDPSVKSISSNVLVGRIGKTGRQDYFLSNKTTELPPSRVVESEGRPVINPDWDGINKNVTFDSQGKPRLFKREPDGVYRPIQKGEENGVYINVQRPYNGPEISNSSIIDEDIDAIMVGPNKYRLIDEQNQVVNPKTVDELQERRTLDTEVSREGVSTDDVVEKLTQMGIPRGIATIVALSVAGSVMDDGEPGVGTYTGLAAGLLLGFPSIRGRVSGSFRRGVRRDKDAFEEFAKKSIDDDNLADVAREAYIKGFDGDLNNKEALENFLNSHQVINNAKRSGKSVSGIWKAFMKSPVVQSGKEFFSSVGGPVSKRLGEVFDRWHGQAAVTERKITDRVLESIDVEGMPRDIVEDVRGGRFNDVSVKVVREALGEEIPEERAIKIFGDSMKRTITHEADVDAGGVLRYSDSPSAQREYDSPVVRDIDSSILSSQAGRALRDGIRKGFDDVADDNIAILNKRATEIFQEMERGSSSRQAGVRALKDFIKENSSMTYRQFKKTRSPQEKKQLSTILAQEPNAKALIEYKNSSVRINNMKGKYYPQLLDREAEPLRFENFVRDHASDLDGLSEAQKREAFKRRESERILEMNNDKFDLLEMDIDGMDVSSRAFKSKNQASAELERLISADESTGVVPISDAEIRRVVRSDIESGNINKYVRSRTIKGETHYYLTTPKNLKDRGINLYKEKNITELGSAHETYTKHSLVKKSHFIDSPRKYIMPNDMLKTDVQEVIQRYSYDAGRRMYAIKNKMANVTELNEHWLTRIAREVEEKGGDVSTAKDKLRTWYKVAAKTHDIENYGRRELTGNAEELARRYDNMEKSERWALTIRKLSTAPFLYATTFYSWLTPAVLGTFLTSGKSILSGYKMALSDPQRFRRWSDEIRRSGVLKEMLHAIRPELQRMGSEITDSAGDAGAIHRTVDWAADTSATMSFTKPLYKALGIDYENSGALRLFTGNMFDISSAETTITIYGGMKELDNLSRQGKKLFDRMKNDVQLSAQERREFGIIERRMKEMGIDNPTRFMEKNEELSNYIQGLDEGRRLTADEIDSWTYDQITQSMNTIVDNYHGRTIMSRPTKWLDNPIGRVLSTFSVYAQNFGQQTLLSRIYRPVRDFHRNFAEEADMSAFKLHYYMKRGNEDKLRSIFGDRWEEAIEQYPIEVYDNLFKVLGTIGVGKVMLISRAGMLDITSIMANESLGNPDYERWRNINKQWTLNPRAPEDEQVTFGELFSDDEFGYDTLRLLGGTLSVANDMGFFGRYVQAAQQLGEHPQGGPFAATPTGGIAHNTTQSISRSFNAILSMDAERMSTDIPRELLDTALFMAPGAGTFFDARKAVVDTVVPKQQKSGGGTLFNPTTGNFRETGRLNSTVYY